MGTHSLILFQTKTNGLIEKYVVIYQQYDGYPSGVGLKLVNFIESKKIVNGYSDKYVQANGFNCLIAQYISSFKDGAGNLYVEPMTTILDEEWNYIVTFDENTKSFVMQVNDGEEMTFEQFKNSLGG
jgi:hypothetical protein